MSCMVFHVPLFPWLEHLLLSVVQCWLVLHWDENWCSITLTVCSTAERLWKVVNVRLKFVPNILYFARHKVQACYQGCLLVSGKRHVYTEDSSHHEGGQTLEWGWRTGGMFIHRDIQTSKGWSPTQPEPVGPAWTGRWNLVTLRGPCSLNYSVISKGDFVSSFSLLVFKT